MILTSSVKTMSEVIDIQIGGVEISNQGVEAIFLGTGILSDLMWLSAMTLCMGLVKPTILV